MPKLSLTFAAALMSLCLAQSSAHAQTDDQLGAPIAAEQPEPPIAAENLETPDPASHAGGIKQRTEGDEMPSDYGAEMPTDGDDEMPTDEDTDQQPNDTNEQ